MTNYREILRLKNLGISNTDIRLTLGCSRQTVVTTLQKADEHGLKWPLPEAMTNSEIFKLFFPCHVPEVVYEMPDVEWVYKEMQKPGVSLSLLWYEYAQS